MNSIALNNFNIWKNKLESISNKDFEALLKMDEEIISDSFYKDLSFGTGGLRGKMGLGTNRINAYTIYKATRGVGLHLKTKFNKPSVVIGYDSRNHSLTASHNPKEYNGYKVYNDGGNQITLEEANQIISRINNIDPLDEFLKFIDDKNTKHLINEIEEDLIDAFIKSTKNTSLLQDFSDKGIKIVYTPLNGAGYKIVPQVLKECGFKNLLIVEEQKNPDGNFPTCPKPNPELKEAMELGIKLAKLIAIY